MEIKVGAKNAITANKNIFTTETYSKARLYVPVGSKNSYEKVTPWNKFHIAEMDFTGIDKMEHKEKGMETIYDLNGCIVKNPTKGIYIINGKKTIVK